ncbi:hypothetical protein PHISCL_08072 [Aspergillus sclerotialis]|uniref:C6 transcription factor n=1 Tax=Aspergillus sclerotialis TaxID=2070753 RepID=A0A3A2Z8X8_9EURO|nr:hypothetical protein PHISCL_08072 [Aspergillus sclerotialis]
MWVRSCVFPHQPQRSRPRACNRRASFRDEAVSQDGSSSAEVGNELSIPIQPLSFNLPSRRSTGANGSSSHLNMTDLKLMQHYILHTSKRMSFKPTRSFAWERVVPDIVTANEFLMHLLLALAGLDYFTHDQHSQQLLNTSMNNPTKSRDLDPANLQAIIEHHQLGLEGLRRALDGATEANVETLTAGSMLIVAFAFASLRVRDFDLSDVCGVRRPRIDWLHLVRGASSVVRQNWASLIRGRLRHLLLFNYVNDDWKLCQGELESASTPPVVHSKRLSAFAAGARRAIYNLREFSNALTINQNFPRHSANSTSSPSSEQNQQPSVKHIYEEHTRAIDVVEDMYMRILHVLHFARIEPQSPSDHDVLSDVEDTAATSWPILLSQEFLSSLDSYESFGVVEGTSFTILAHLHLTLALLENIWYLGPSIDREIEKINSLILTLGNDDLFRLMQWPMEVIE